MVTPEQPFVFFPEGLDVRWRSFAALAGQVEEGRRALAELGLAAGAVVAYRWRCGPDGVAADLAIRTGGWTALPLSEDPRGEVGAPERPAARLLLPGETMPPGVTPPVRRARLPQAGSEHRRRRDETGFPASEALTGGVMVRRGASWRRIGPDDLAAGAADLGRRIGAGLGSGGDPGTRRPVVVAQIDPEVPAGRLLLDWAVASRVALYPVGQAGTLGGTAGWGRPSVVAGQAAGLEAVASEIRRRGGAWDRSGWWSRVVGRRRLGVAVLLGGRPGADTLALLAQQGVHLVEPPELRESTGSKAAGG